MIPGLTERLQRNRLTVVAVDKDTGRVRVKGEGDACSDLSCGERTLVVADEGPTGGIEALNAGDIIRVEPAGGRPERIVVVRRVWDELTSPEL